MSSRMRVTKGHTRNRRAHHAISAPRLSECSNCGDYHLRHKVCEACGFYKGNDILKLGTSTAKPQEAAETTTEA